MVKTCDYASERPNASQLSLHLERVPGGLKMVAKKHKQQAADTPKGAAKPKPKKKTSRGK